MYRERLHLNKPPLTVSCEIRKMNNSYGKIPTIDQLSTEEAAVLFTISTVIAIVALPLNILVLFGYLCSSSARQKPSSILLASMTFGHVLTGSWIIPFHMVFQMIKPGLVESGGTLCTILLPMTYSPYVAISETILLMTVDRYFAVCAMMKYRLIMTRRRTFAAVLFTWLHALVYGAIILPFGYKIEYNHRLGTCGVDFENRLLEGGMMAVVYAVIPLFIMAMLSYKTVKHLRRHNRRLVSNSETVRPPDGESDSRYQAIRGEY